MVNMTNHQHENCSECVTDWWEWARDNVKEPISGFQDKKNPDGGPFNLSQQRGATHVQIYWIICDLCRRGKDSGKIQAILRAFTRPAI